MQTASLASPNQNHQDQCNQPTIMLTINVSITMNPRFSLSTSHKAKLNTKPSISTTLSPNLKCFLSISAPRCQTEVLCTNTSSKALTTLTKMPPGSASRRETNEQADV